MTKNGTYVESRRSLVAGFRAGFDYTAARTHAVSAIAALIIYFAMILHAAAVSPEAGIATNAAVLSTDSTQQKGKNEASASNKPQPIDSTLAAAQVGKMVTVGKANSGNLLESRFSMLNPRNLIPLAIMAIISILLLRTCMLFFKDWLSPELQLAGILPGPSLNAWPKALAEDNAISRLRSELNRDEILGKPTMASSTEQPTEPGVPDTTQVDIENHRHALKEFFSWAPGHMIEVIYNCEKLGRASNSLAMRNSLMEITSQLVVLKQRAALPELRPISQVALGLEGLIKQLVDRMDRVTPSSIKTLTDGIHLLGEISVPELRADLATNPPIRILAVDDDPISRFALVAALKKVFPEPELAKSGAEALASTANNKFDLILLDIRMPGMDGIEVCSKVRDTILNQSTPVVFVTSLDDFTTQAQAIKGGGVDVIAKPFLAFEIAVKALTLVLEARHHARDGAVAESNSSGTFAIQLPLIPATHNNLETGPLPVSIRLIEGLQSKLGEGKPASLFVLLEEMRGQIREVGQTLDESGRREKLSSLSAQSKALIDLVESSSLRPLSILCVALEKLLNKLHDRPANASVSTLETAAAAVDLILDSSRNGAELKTSDTDAIRILVADDEPLSRRAITGALINASLSPDSAENGAKALEAASKQSYDVIFLDVEMAEMDGFTACSRIRETQLNKTTPVIFLTSHTDVKTRAQSSRSGGSDFVIKPFLSVEVTVKALTYGLLGKIKAVGLETKTFTTASSPT